MLMRAHDLWHGSHDARNEDPHPTDPIDRAQRPKHTHEAEVADGREIGEEGGCDAGEDDDHVEPVPPRARTLEVGGLVATDAHGNHLNGHLDSEDH
jgi:hypothetical protein